MKISKLLLPLIITSSLLLTACGDPTVDISHAGSYGSTKNIQKYLDKGVDVNEKDEDGDTALHNAVIFGYPENVKFLLAKGANVNIRNNDGDTPLSAIGVFKKQNHAEIIKLLLAKGADVNAQNNDGESALFGAVLFSNIANVKLLLDSGANINLKDKAGDKAYYPACDSESAKAQQILKMFIAKGAKCS